jgi:hypothetical protein
MESLFQVLSNLPPTVAMTLPPYNAMFPAGTPITLAANAGDADGIVTQVTFYVQSMSFFNAPHQLIGVAPSPPYQAIAGNLAPDHYVAVAEARDNKGAVGYSLGNEFTVAQPAGTPDLRIRFQVVGTSRFVTLEWDDQMAMLQHSPKVTGPWTDIPTAASPYPVPTTQSADYFRLRFQ